MVIFVPGAGLPCGPAICPFIADVVVFAKTSVDITDVDRPNATTSAPAMREENGFSS